MAKAYWLGIDIGTGGSRALLVDASGSIHGAVTVAHAEMTMARPLWAEQDPDDWWRASRQAIRQVLQESGVSGEAVRGVSFSGQMHGLVLLNRAGEVIRPALIWCDQRSQQQVDWINQTVGKDRVLHCIANPVLTGFTLPKLLWVRDHEPENYEQIRKLMLPKDYIRYKLTGEVMSEVSDASGTALFDVVNRRWSYELATAVGVDRDLLPEVVESTDQTGTISAQAAEETGLRRGTPVFGGGGDQAASAVGNGVVRSGLISDTIGTSGVVFAHMDEARYDASGRVHTFCHAVRGRWHVMGVTQGAGLSLQWFRNNFGNGQTYNELTALAATAKPGAEGLFWMPYLMGERTPHLDAYARGGWVGLTAKHGRAELIRSLLEGVTYSQKDCLEIIANLGVEATAVRLSGGGAKSPFWCQIFADVFNTPVVTLETQEGSAFGAALLAMVGTGEFHDVPQACAATIREQNRVLPNAEQAAFYGKAYQQFRGLYPALRGSFHQMREIS